MFNIWQASGLFRHFMSLLQYFFHSWLFSDLISLYNTCIVTQNINTGKRTIWDWKLMSWNVLIMHLSLSVNVKSLLGYAVMQATPSLITLFQGQSTSITEHRLSFQYTHNGWSFFASLQMLHSCKNQLNFTWPLLFTLIFKLPLISEGREKKENQPEQPNVVLHTWAEINLLWQVDSFYCSASRFNHSTVINTWVQLRTWMLSNIIMLEVRSGTLTEQSKCLQAGCSRSSAH